MLEVGREGRLARQLEQAYHQWTGLTDKKSNLMRGLLGYQLFRLLPILSCLFSSQKVTWIYNWASGLDRSDIDISK